MYLHNDTELFREVIAETAISLSIDPSIIEKDYYVTLMLEKIVSKQPDIIFKGGTSLSKCYKLIRRFSEDIDLNLQCDIKPTEGQRKRLKRSITETIDVLGFVLTNAEDVRSRREFNKYIISYPTLFNASYLKQQLVVETAVFLRAYPCKRMCASSYVYEYLKQKGHTAVIKEYALEPYELNVQAAERTLVDKIYALGDYYIVGNVTGHSRHIYDICKLLEIVVLNDELKQLNTQVRMERQKDKQCPSAKDNVCVNALLQEIVDTDAYKTDYEKITQYLLFEKMSYSEAKKGLQLIIDSGLF